ncbi:hypothetical protein AQUCO_00100006v1 [Aquilegia coerulea]|uniref:Uncharacterized protein n=1 Tax=Aquilegia coerulea TaxID=218851 RepID=A0A2G5F893_AQUCA|nr:hypothetical protein AQUCO_00100006v1 [Aquilegia coerulea]
MARKLKINLRNLISSACTRSACTTLKFCMARFSTSTIESKVEITVTFKGHSSSTTSITIRYSTRLNVSST